MENGYRKSLNIRFHLDPRTKLLLLILFSVVVMIDVTDGPAYIVRAIMTYIPVVLVCLEGKPHVGARFTVLFILATWLMEITQENIGGIAGMLILFLCYMITQFAPTMIMVWYCISTTKISEFMAAMNRMRLPQGLAISIAVMMRFFPTLSEEYRSIRDAMRMRGIAFGGGKVPDCAGNHTADIELCPYVPEGFQTGNAGAGRGKPQGRTGGKAESPLRGEKTDGGFGPDYPAHL